jgi:digeranylgeranylglycerophospholipid reductase
MPVRATKRGTDRTRFQRGDCDVLVCGASFAGLAVARELAGSGARVLMIDRYELGERQTSACAMPTVWMQALDLMDSLRQSFDHMIVHTPFGTFRWSLPWSFSTFDYRELCALLRAQAGDGDIELETATVIARDGFTVHTDRGELRAPLIVDALGWRRVLSNATTIQPPAAPLSRGLEVHPAGRDGEMQLWIDPKYVRAGYAWSFPALDELRVGTGSFWPSHHVREPTVRLAGELGLAAEGYQGNWIPHELRSAAEDGVFFVGDSAGHCLPLTAEGIRTAMYFGLACGRELRAVLERRRSRAEALGRYGAFSDRHKRKYRWMLASQRVVGRVTPSRAVTAWVRALENRRIAHWIFEQYLAIAPPSFVDRGSRTTASHAAGLAPATAWR